MNVFESIRIALRGLSSNKLRSFLTMLGIIIGVAAVIALLSVGQGVQASITAQIQSTGSNLITITPGGQRSSNARIATTGGQQATLTSQDAQAIIDAGLPDVAGVSPEFGTGGQIQFGSQTSSGQITGVMPDYLAVHNMNVANGEFITKAENDSVSQVVVLGSALAKALFNDMDPVGQTVKLNRANYRVVGVLEEKGGVSFSSPDNGAFVPLTSAQRRLIGGGRGFGVGQRVSTIGVSAASEAQVDSCHCCHHGDPAYTAQGPVPAGRLHGHQPEADSERIRSGDGYSHRFPGRNCWHFPAGRRHRHHEHHVGVGQ